MGNHQSKKKEAEGIFGLEGVEQNRNKHRKRTVKRNFDVEIKNIRKHQKKKAREQAEAYGPRKIHQVKDKQQDQLQSNENRIKAVSFFLIRDVEILEIPLLDLIIDIGNQGKNGNYQC